jgi:hypothetical protein
VKQGRRSTGMVRDPRAEPGARALRRETDCVVFFAPGSAGGCAALKETNSSRTTTPGRSPGLGRELRLVFVVAGGGGGVAGVEAFAEEGVEFGRIAAERRLRCQMAKCSNTLLRGVADWFNWVKGVHILVALPMCVTGGC